MPGIAQALQQQRQLDRPAIAALNEAGEAPAEDAQASGNSNHSSLETEQCMCCRELSPSTLEAQSIISVYVRC